MKGEWNGRNKGKREGAHRSGRRNHLNGTPWNGWWITDGHAESTTWKWKEWNGRKGTVGTADAGVSPDTTLCGVRRPSLPLPSKSGGTARGPVPGLGWTRGTSEPGLSRSGRSRRTRLDDPDFNGPSLMTPALVGDSRATARSPLSRGRNNPRARRIDRPVSCCPFRMARRRRATPDNARFNRIRNPVFHATGVPTRRSSNLRLGPEPSATLQPARRYCSRHLDCRRGRSPPRRGGTPTAQTARHAPFQMKAELAQLPQANGGRAKRTARIDAATSAGRTGGSRPLAQFVRQADALTSWPMIWRTGGGNTRSNAGGSRR